jgi:outer membrane lipoprotein-sorting protein
MPSPRTRPKPPAAAPRASRRLPLLLAALLIAGPARASALSAADQQLVSQVETYLNKQSGLTANFLQVAADGSTRTGKAWLERPGKMRFEYDPPDKQLLVAGFGVLTYYDPQLNQTSNIPLGATPLGILLSQHVDLTGGNVEVTGITREPGEDDITVVRKDKPAAGSLTLVLGTGPLELRQWVVRDAQGQETRVSLYDIDPGGPYPDSLFQFATQNPIPSGG